MKVRLSNRANKALWRLPDAIQLRVHLALQNLEKDPPQGDIKRLQGSNLSRVRVGDYRILFGVDEGEIIITDLGVRGQIYKRRN
ncbi:MAG: type II toxin-antitoxin system RelE/ParE family toxin [Planctomycetota bacterium]|jgi:mRNA interferase RelE/StbE|nr:type II toxin-antitoxin system RelE/ParE family toxin [Planctomycetota bacterium]